MNTKPTPSAIGLLVPDFTVDTTNGLFHFHARLGRPLVLYFYPRDKTPGCTIEAGQFRDLYADFQSHDCEILGISRDSLTSHASFKTKLGLPFSLAADSDEHLCKMFNVIRPKSMYGKQVMGIERSTFLIDRTGILRQEWRKVKADGHAKDVLVAVRSL